MPKPWPTNLPIHYGWIIMVTGTLAIFACIGLGRFSLGMLLPSMGRALGLTYSQMGFLSTANFVGYLLAVLVCSKIMKRCGARNLIAMALILVGISMILISYADSMTVIAILYILTGVGSAMANVPTMALIATWFESHKRGQATGFVVIGSGFAIILSGLLIPSLNALHNDGWRWGWMTLGIVVLFCSALCYLIFRNNPDDIGLVPVGADHDARMRSSVGIPPFLPIHSRIVWHIAAIYFLFGFSYVIYLTFIVTSMVEDRGYAESAAGSFWSWFGALSLVSGPLLGTFSDTFGRRAGLVTVFSIQAIAYLLVALRLPDFFLFLSIGCYGLVAWSVPSIITALAADYAGPQRIATIFGFVTFIFGIGQILGPSLAGMVAERSGSFSGSFVMAFVMALVAVVLSLLLPAKNKS